MYVTYIRGIYTTWRGVATIEHYTSKDLFYWDHVGPLSFGSKTCYADSSDLYSWEFRGVATSDESQEGPNVFELCGKYWLLADVGYAQAVYYSDDCEKFTRQSENILTKEGGTRTDDCDFAHHGDVYVHNGRAFIVYHTHPDKSFPERTPILMAELKVVDGVLTCDRNATFSVN